MTSEPSTSWCQLSRAQQVSVEECIAGFERRWHEHACAEIDQFLPSNSDLREIVRLELLAIDQDFRLQSRSISNSTQPNAASDGETPFLPDISHESHVAQFDTHSQTSFPWGVSGLRLVSHYEAPTEKLAGGLGDVWIVREPSLSRTVVVKQLKWKWRLSARARHAFLQEVRITSLLEHPGVPPVHGVGQTDGGLPCYSMRYIHGETFSQAIARYHQTEHQPSTLRDLLVHFITVCNTVAYAHSRGVLHRDLKPSNIMLGPYGQTMVIDWGLAKQFKTDGQFDDQAAPAEHMSVADSCSSDTQVADRDATQLDLEFEKLTTSLGDVVGTPAFMSPEQATGNVLDIDVRTDVFALGGVLFNILYGVPPFSNSARRDALQCAEKCEVQYPHSPPRSLPKGLLAICAKAMQPRPELRYCDANFLASDIQNWLTNEPVTAMPQPMAQRLMRMVRQRKSLAIVTMVSIIAMCALAAWGIIGVQLERAHKLIAEKTAVIKSQATDDIADYLSQIFDTADPVNFEQTGFVDNENPAAQRTLQRILERGSVLINDHLAGDPVSHSELLAHLGKSFIGLADFDRAQALLEKSLAIRLAHFSSSSAQVLQTQVVLGRLAQEMGQYDLAEVRYREVIAKAKAAAPPLVLLETDAKYHLAWMLFYQPLSLDQPQFRASAVKESIQLFSEVIETRQNMFGTMHRSVGLGYAGLAAAMLCYPEQQVLAQVAALQALEILNTSGQESSLGSFMVAYQQAERLRKEGCCDQAEAIYLELKQTILLRLGNRHPVYLLHLWNMAGHYRKFGQADRAEKVIDEVRASIGQLASLRSNPVHLDGLCQYAEALIQINPSKATEVAKEVILFASERPEIDLIFQSRAQLLLARLDPKLADTADPMPPIASSQEVTP